MDLSCKIVDVISFGVCGFFYIGLILGLVFVMKKGCKMNDYYFIDEDRMNLRFPVYEKGKFKRFSWSNFLVGKKVHTGGEVMCKPEQCTGARDAEGRLVYENDIVKHHRGEIGIVEWYAGTCQFFIDDIENREAIDVLDDICNYEVIGNIHENKELLK